MKKRPRIYYSAKQRALIWERWRKPSSTRSLDALTNGREKRFTTERQHNDFMKLLQRRVESAAKSCRWG